MNKNKILIVWSNYYSDLAKKQLDSCILLLKHSKFTYEIEEVTAGTYELPAVIQYYHRHDPHEGYLPLGLLLKGSTDHYEFIWQHIKECFIQLTMDGICIGNGIITAPTMELLTARVEQQERIKEAFFALDYLIQLKRKLETRAEKI